MWESSFPAFLRYKRTKNSYSRKIKEKQRNYEKKIMDKLKENLKHQIIHEQIVH